MKTKEELSAIKEELASLKCKLAELSEDELAVVIGGTGVDIRKDLYENVILSRNSAEDHNVML